MLRLLTTDDHFAASTTGLPSFVVVTAAPPTRRRPLTIHLSSTQCCQNTVTHIHDAHDRDRDRRRRKHFLIERNAQTQRSSPTPKRGCSRRRPRACARGRAAATRPALVSRGEYECHASLRVHVFGRTGACRKGEGERPSRGRSSSFLFPPLNAGSNKPQPTFINNRSRAAVVVRASETGVRQDGDGDGDGVAEIASGSTKSGGGQSARSGVRQLRRSNSTLLLLPPPSTNHQITPTPQHTHTHTKQQPRRLRPPRST